MNAPQGKSSVLKWVGLGCGALVLIGACIAGSCALCAGGIYSSTEAPAQAAHAFFADVRAQNWQNAHARMSASYQSRHTPQSMQMAAAQLPALSQQTDSTFSNRSVNMAGATLDGHLTTPGGNVPVQVTLSQSGESWYIDSVVVQGMPLQ